MSSGLYLFGRALGLLCGVGAAAAWAMAMWFPEAGLPLSGITLVVAFLMMLLAILAVIASVHGHAVVLLVVFVASFLPVGMHLLALANWFQWIGWLNIGFLLAGLMTWIGGRGRARASASGEQAD